VLYILGIREPDDDFQELKVDCLEVLRVGEKERLKELGRFKEQIRELAAKKSQGWIWKS